MLSGFPFKELTANNCFHMNYYLLYKIMKNVNHNFPKLSLNNLFCLTNKAATDNYFYYFIIIIFTINRLIGLSIKCQKLVENAHQNFSITQSDIFKLLILPKNL